MDDPIVASRAEDSIVRALAQEPHEVTRVRQQQEILRDLLEDLSTVNETVRQRVRSRLDMDLIERRVRDSAQRHETARVKHVVRATSNSLEGRTLLLHPLRAFLAGETARRMRRDL